jgi:hypothetical protein
VNISFSVIRGIQVVEKHWIDHNCEVALLFAIQGQVGVQWRNVGIDVWK